MNTIDTMDYMGDWMDKAFRDELNEDMFASEDEAASRKSFDLLVLK